jgi:hypothetical protein
MPTGHKKKQKKQPPRSRFHLERLTPRLLLNASQEWMTEINPDEVFDHPHYDGGLSVFYSDPATWSASDIEFHSRQEFPWLSDHFTDSNNEAGTDQETYQSVGYNFAESTSTYTLYLNFDGGDVQGRSSDSWLYSYDASVPAFDLGMFGWSGREAEAIEYITEFVREDYAAYDVEVISERPASGQYTTIFVGGNNDWFQASGGVIGVATYDVGNTRSSNYGFAFIEELTTYYNSSSGSLLTFSEYVSNLISHEAGHTYGANHINDTSAIMNPYLPIFPVRSMFGSGSVHGSSTNQDTQSLLGTNTGNRNIPDDYGDSAGQAALIDILSSRSGILERRDDVDVFRFSALTGSNMSIDVLATDYANLTAQLEVYRASDLSLLTVSDVGFNDVTNASFTPTAGDDYYLFVSSMNQDSSGQYTLSFNGNANWQPEAQIDPEAIVREPAELNPLGDQSFSDSLTAGQPTHLYPVALDSAGLLDLILEIDSAQAGYMAVYDQSGELLDWTWGNEDSPILLSPSVLGRAPMYVAIGSINGASLFTYQLAMDSPGVLSQPITLNQNASGQVSGSISAADTDYFEILAPANSDGQFTASIDISGIWDTHLNLYDSAGSLLRRVDESGVTGDESLTFDGVFPNQSYYLRVGGKDFSQVGDYQLDVAFSTLPETSLDLSAESDAIYSMYDMGQIARGAEFIQTIVVTNNGGANLLLSNVALTAPFQWIDNGDDVVQPGESTELIFSVNPATRGLLAGELTLSSNDPILPVRSVDLLAEVTGGILTIQENAQTPDDGQIDFGELQVFQTAWEPVELINSGDGPLRITDLDSTLPFRVDPDLTPANSDDDIVLVAGQSITVLVGFSPTDIIETGGMVTITTDDIESPVTNLTVQGQPLAGILEISELDGTLDQQFDFGSVETDSAYTDRVWNLENHGNIPITVSLWLDNDQDFRVLGLNTFVLPAGQSRDVQVLFSSHTAHALQDQLNLTANDMNQTQADLTLNAQPYAKIGNGQKYQFIDHSGDPVSLTLNGKATAHVTTGLDNQPDIASVQFMDTDGSETLSIRVQKRGTTSLGAITGDVDLKGIKARHVDLVGSGIALNGELARLDIGNILEQSQVNFSGTDKTAIRTGQVAGDAAINIDGELGTFQSLSFTGSHLRANHLKRVNVKGDLEADIEVLDGDLAYLKVQNGDVAGNVTVNGNVGKLLVQNGDYSANLSATGDINQILVKGGDLSGSIQSETRINRIKADIVSQASIAALQGIDRIDVKTDMMRSSVIIGFDSNQSSSSARAGQQIDTWLGALNVRGTFAGSTVAVGIQPDSDGSFILGQPHAVTGMIGKVKINEVHTNNNTDPFGLIARSAIDKLTVNRETIADGYQQDDFIVTILDA